MRFIKFLRSFSYISILILCNAKLHAQSEDGKRLIALEKKRFEAMIRHDTSQLAVLLADSLTYIHSSGVIDNKTSFLKDVGSGRIVYLFILPEKITVFTDGNYGWIFGRANIRFKLASMIGTIDQYISFVEVYHLQRFQWQMVLCQNARIEKNAPYLNNLIPQVKAEDIPAIY
jgi:hypothetical protein